MGSPTQMLAKYLATTFQPFVELTPSYVKNSRHFVDLIKDLRLEMNDMLVSFDVTSLFTQVPIEETLDVIRKKHKPPDYIMDLTKHCLSNTYFTYEGQRYKQIEGAPMGSPLSPALANLFMEYFETRALETAKHKPKMWFRYVDDTFVIWPQHQIYHGEGTTKSTAFPREIGKISHVLRKHEIDTTFNTDRKIAEILPTPKETISLENPGVYEIKCETCQSSYIGQTNRSISTQKEEHRNAVKQRTTTSSLVKHVIDTGHKIDFEDVRMLARSENLTDRITRPAIEIEKRSANLNKRDDSQRLPAIWRTVLTKPHEQVTRHSTDRNIIKKDTPTSSASVTAATKDNLRPTPSGPVTRSRTRIARTPRPITIEENGYKGSASEHTDTSPLISA
ncbi:hypothetical protein Trydic_g9871 [Trypoxylus dichotomus]